MDNDLSPKVFCAPTLEEEWERYVPLIKEFRKEVDTLIRRVTKPEPNQEASGKEIIPHAYKTNEAVTQVRIKLVEAKMWAGKILEALGNPFPPELADKAE
jgi:hypothetical protein